MPTVGEPKASPEVHQFTSDPNFNLGVQVASRGTQTPDQINTQAEWVMVPITFLQKGDLIRKSNRKISYRRGADSKTQKPLGGPKDYGLTLKASLELLEAQKEALKETEGPQYSTHEVLSVTHYQPLKPLSYSTNPQGSPSIGLLLLETTEGKFVCESLCHVRASRPGGFKFTEDLTPKEPKPLVSTIRKPSRWTDVSAFEGEPLDHSFWEAIDCSVPSLSNRERRALLSKYLEGVSNEPGNSPEAITTLAKGELEEYNTRYRRAFKNAWKWVVSLFKRKKH